MKKKTLCLCVIGLLAAAGLLTGCTRTSEELILSKKNSATEEEMKTSLPENKDLARTHYRIHNERQALLHERGG